MISTGQIFFFGGIAGMAVTAVVALICIGMMRKKGEALRSEIWKNIADTALDIEKTGGIEENEDGYF